MPSGILPVTCWYTLYVACRNCVDTCNCAIISSDGSVTITGTGTVVDPYNVEAHPVLSATYTVPGALAVQTGAVRYYFSSAVTITNVVASVGTAPTGTSLIVDVRKNGSTIFTTTANRPTIAVSNFVDMASVPDVTAVAAGDYLTIDIVQVGSGVSGNNLVVTVEYTG